MRGSWPISFEGRYYSLSRAHAEAEGAGLGRALDAAEATSALARMMRDPDACTRLRERFAELSESPGCTQRANDSILRWLEQNLRGASGMGSLVLAVRAGLFVEHAKASELAEPHELREAARVDGLLRQLGAQDIPHRGHGYRVVRAEHNAQLAQRATLEVLHEREAKRVLEQLAQEPLRPEGQRKALDELVGLFDKLRGKRALELLVLRRYREYVRAAEPETTTLAELRKARAKHWLEVELVDEADKPVTGVRLLLVSLAGDQTTHSSDDQGRVRVEPIAAGDLTIRLPDLDGGLWRPLGGAPARESTQQPGYARQIVRRGENLARIARRHGLSGWNQVWQDAKNEPLRKKRKNPHLLWPGDEVMVPGKRVMELLRPVDATHRIRVQAAELLTFKVVLQDHNQLPFADEDYELRLDAAPAAEPRKGKTDGAGTVIQKLPAHAARVRVRLIERKLSWSFGLTELSEIPAADEQEQDGKPSARALEAAQMRLNALGFPCGSADGTSGARTRNALALLRPEDVDEHDASNEQSAEASAGPEQDPPLALGQLALNELAQLFTV